MLNLRLDRKRAANCKPKLRFRWTWAVSIFLAFQTVSLFADEKVNFNRQIRPLLNKHCIACHGPDEGDRQADLRLDTFAGATDYAIIPGDAEGSDVLDRVTTDDIDLRMPPADHADALNAEEIALLKKWIDEGANFQTHWAFAPIVASEVPTVEKSLPSELQLLNSIDNFILARVKDAGLSQNRPALPRSIVRRVSLDLTGLPPGFHGLEIQSAIKAYLAQPSNQKLERLIDGLMETPSYAEHWASMWLDIARYADTCGYSGDEQRDVWPWRDWLIRSIQEKKSYRDLSVEMLAGDLLPDPTEDQKLATAFHRNTLANNEGGTNDEEFRVIAVKDRLSTTLNAWMGLTVRCAECHSHKYDPISHLEYYQLLDFFNQTVDSDNRDDRPKLEVRPTPDPAVSAKLNAEIAELEVKQKKQPQVWSSLRPAEMNSREGTKFELLEDDSILALGPNPGVEEYAFTFEVPVGTKIRAIRLEAIPHVKHNGNVGRSPEGAFILSQIRMTQIDPEKVEQKKGAAVKDTAKEATSSETWVPFVSAANDFNQDNRHAKNAIAETVESGGDQGWAVKHPVDGYKTRHEAIFELKETYVATENSKFKIYLLHDPPWKRLSLGCVRFSICNIEHAVTKYDDKKLDQANREIAKLIAKRDSPVRVPVISERAAEHQRETFVMLRGNFQSPGEKVRATFPDAFPAESDVPLNRLGLTQWMFSGRNPLTARVAVNRYWARIMGIGLVETEEDFGTQGSPPTHPELLNHLASEFRGDWDVRKLLKKIILSATYQQSQLATEKALEIDPRNRLLARGPRVRLSAEVVRDQALAVSGLLSKKLYGKPVYPPNPIKRVVNAFTGGMTWQESEGEDRYRRALYTFLKRSAPHPLFETFDVSSRDVCSMRRLRTNTPLQSFMTLNDVTFIEAARGLGQKMLDSTAARDIEDKKKKLDVQIGLGVEAALFEPANETQVEVLADLYLKSQKRFESDLTNAAAMVGKDTKKFDPESLTPAERSQLISHASMTVVSNVILNLDSFLNN